METEKIAICEENGEPLGIRTRKEVHEYGYWHNTFHCWIVSNEAGNAAIHLQLRSGEKKDFPSLFDITAAGHILADETVEDGVREIREELGIAVSFDELVPLGVIKDQIHETGFMDNERCHTFLYKAENNLDAVYELQQEEVAGVATAAFEDFYGLCFGLIREIEVEGFLVSQEGNRTAFHQKISLQDLVPHGESYLRNVAVSIKAAL